MRYYAIINENIWGGQKSEGWLPKRPNQEWEEIPSPWWWSVGGYNLCNIDDLMLGWLSHSEIWVAEGRGVSKRHPEVCSSMTVFEEVRLLRRTGWTEKRARELVFECAKEVAHRADKKNHSLVEAILDRAVKGPLLSIQEWREFAVGFYGWPKALATLGIVEAADPAVSAAIACLQADHYRAAKYAVQASLKVAHFRGRFNEEYAKVREKVKKALT